MFGNPKDPAFIQLLERWFEFAVFCPVLRMHGDRDPNDMTPLCKDKEQDYGGGFLYTGQPNEFWSYTPEAQKVMEKNLKLRLTLKEYIAGVMKEAHLTGAPVMRTMFFAFSDDAECWKCTDQYMFGSEYLVAPILHANEFSRDVYLPQGKWENIADGKKMTGGKHITVAAPIDCIPVFKRS